MASFTFYHYQNADFSKIVSYARLDERCLIKHLCANFLHQLDKPVYCTLLMAGLAASHFMYFHSPRIEQLYSSSNHCLIYNSITIYLTDLSMHFAWLHKPCIQKVNYRRSLRLSIVLNIFVIRFTCQHFTIQTFLL